MPPPTSTIVARWSAKEISNCSPDGGRGTRRLSKTEALALRRRAHELVVADRAGRIGGRRLKALGEDALGDLDGDLAHPFTAVPHVRGQGHLLVVEQVV